MRRPLDAALADPERHEAPKTLSDLHAHRGILYSNRDADWRFSGAEGWKVVRPQSCMRVNNGMVKRDAALAGYGICLLPTFFTHAELKAGTLVEIDIGMQAEGAELFVCYPLARTASAKVRALYESLRRDIGNPPYWEV